MQNQRINDIRDLQEATAKAEDELLGFDHEVEEFENETMDGVFEEQLFEAEKIRIETKVLSLTYLVDLIKKGKLELHPDFQRNEIWDIKRKSLLIESLMLRIPIPAFYLFEDGKGNKFVIDGLQRLSTIFYFLEGDFALSDLQYLGGLYNGKNIYEIKERHRTRIDETQFTVNIIDSRNPAQVKYDIFRRINTGGMPLKPQEIRNIVSNLTTRELLKDLSTCEEFLIATRRRINDLRMDAQELVLKFFLYYRCYDRILRRPAFSNNNLQTLLDNEIEIINTYDLNDLYNLKRVFKESMVKAYSLFGNKCFSKPGYSYMINKALFISWGVTLSNFDYNFDLLYEKRELIIKKLEDLINFNTDYNKALSISTSSQNNIKKQFGGVNFILEEIYNA